MALGNFSRKEMADKEFKKIKNEISAVIKKEFKNYSDNTKEFWEKAENAEVVAKNVELELQLIKLDMEISAEESKKMNKKLNAFIIFFTIFFLLILFSLDF